MSAELPLPLLAAPLLIAVAAVATMIGATSANAPRRISSELGYKPDPATSLSLTVARYVGGHPVLGIPLPKPMLLLTSRHLAGFARAWGIKLFMIPWDRIEHVVLLTREQMEQASIAVRGLAPGALEAAGPDAKFMRVRYHDDRGWWQNVIFELAPASAEQQAAEVERFWTSYRTDGEERAAASS